MFNRPVVNNSAKVVEGNLIISLPEAKNPVVWRMALGEARAAAIEVQQVKDIYALLLKYPKGDTTEIAQFDDRQAATSALMAVSRAMQDAQGQIHPQRTDAGTAPRRISNGSGLKWLLPLGLIVLALFLFTRSASMVPVAATDTTVAAPAIQGEQTGTPMSADSYLSGM